MRGAPGCDGVELFYVTDEVEQRLMFERGELDILDLDKLGDEAEYFIHGDIYRDRLHTAQQVDISYIALNQAVKPLDDVRVRTALQMSLDRQMILDALYSGRVRRDHDPDRPAPDKAAAAAGGGGGPLLSRRLRGGTGLPGGRRSRFPWPGALRTSFPERIRPWSRCSTGRTGGCTRKNGAARK